MAGAVPYPFETREQYEMSLRLPLGKEWNATSVHRKLTTPRIKTKMGAAIQPLKFIKQPK